MTNIFAELVDESNILRGCGLLASAPFGSYATLGESRCRLTNFARVWTERRPGRKALTTIFAGLGDSNVRV